jgi:predicted enzyme related to lactoylglutathione lyase
MAQDRGAFIWYELMTPDAAGAKAFYDAVVGWDIDAQSAMPGGMDYRMIKRSDGGNAGGVLGMTQDMLDHGGKPVWLGYVQVPDVDAAAQAVVEAGGTVHMGPQDMPGVGRMAMVADPWGASLYLMTPTPPADNPDAVSDVFSYTEAQHVRWNELWTTDQKGAVALYAKLFGWTQVGAMPMGPMGDYLFIQHEAGGIGAIGKAQPGGEGSRWQYFIGVDDIDRALKAVEAGGGKLLGEPQQIPGGEFTVYAHDPQGASFGLVGPRKEQAS